ncbi:MAG: pyridoxal-phosphate dependent enzyme [Pseudomonadota bacterium]
MDTGAEQVTLAAIRETTDRLSPHVMRTPLVEIKSPVFNGVLDAGSLHLKLECFQHTGTFKARGALSNVLSLTDDERARGITAASAGNHAIAAAWAAQTAGISAKVVMQNTANPFRVARARSFGAEVVLKNPGPETFAEAERLARDEGRSFVHPFDGVRTVLGTAGVGLEMMEQMAKLDAVIVSIGGGGLISGIAAAVKSVNPACQVYGVEPTGAACMSDTLASGAPVSHAKVQTIADSLGAPMTLPLGHALCTAYVDEVVTISDDEICAGMVLFQEEAKLAVEPAAGAALAALVGPLKERLHSCNVGVVVCGSNIDAGTYAQQLARGKAHLED